MFGKKSSGTKSKPKKSIKQGPKVNFFAAHAEKLVLALVAGLLGYLVYDGFGGKTYDQARKPDDLKAKASTVSSNIKSGEPWPAIKDTVVVPDGGYTPKTQAARLPTDDKIYSAFPLNGANVQSLVKRGDPKLLPPIKIVGQSVMGLIAVEAPDDFVDPFEETLDAVKLKSKGGSQNRNRNAKFGGGGEGGMMGGDAAGAGGMEGGMMGGYGQAGGIGKRFFPTKYNRGFNMAGGTGMGGSYGGMGGGMGEMGMGGGMGEMGMGGGMGEMGMGGAMGGPGMGGPGGGTGGATGLGGTQRVKPKKYKAELMLFNAVTALVPHEDMVKEFDAKLRESASYNAMRDKPIYLDFKFQRCEVDPRQPNAPENWQDAGDARQQVAMMRKWVTSKMPIPEVIDLTSYDRALTMAIPPLLMQDYRKFAKHPDIDWIWDAGMNQMQVQVPVDENEQTANTDQLLLGERPMTGGGMGGAMGGYGGGMGGAMGGMDGGMGGSMGMEGGMGGAMGMDGGMGGMGGEMGGYGGMGGMGGMGGAMGMDGGMGGMMGSMGGYGGGMGGGMNFMPAKFKMIRFYDKLDPSQIGKTFKYRIMVIMEDPNYPSDRLPAPANTDLETSVFERVSDARKIDDPIIEKYRVENQKAILAARANKTLPRLKFHTRAKRDTGWSEASKPIYVRGYDDVYVHKMIKKAPTPEVEAVVVRLDKSRAAYVPEYLFIEDEDAVKKQLEDLDKDPKLPSVRARMPVFKRGALLGMAAFHAHVPHPIFNTIKRWLNYDKFLENFNTVVDIRGGEPLAGNKSQEDPLTDNVEMMLLMSDGRISITNEFDDTPQFRAFTYADEREAAEKGTSAMGGMGGMGGGMDGGMR